MTPYVTAVGHIDFHILMASAKLRAQQTCGRFLSAEKLKDIKGHTLECDVSMHANLFLIHSPPDLD